MLTKRLTVVFPTYNRCASLVRSVESIRATAKETHLRFVIADGGSTDGSRQWLSGEPDITFLDDTGPLSGAVRPANLCYQVAVQHGADFIGIADDDSISIDPMMWTRAVDFLTEMTGFGGVAFAANLDGLTYRHEHVHGYVYPNFGVVRTEAVRQVARATGDALGLSYLNPIYRHYGADSEAGAWLWKLGWKVHASPTRLAQLATRDVLYQRNITDPDPAIFSIRWKNPERIKPIAERFKSWRDVPCPMWLDHA